MADHGQAMEKMKQLAHFAEDIADNGMPPKLKAGKIDKSKSINNALKKSIKDIGTAYKSHLKLKENSELKKHGGLIINLDLTIQQEKYQADEMEDIIKKR